MKDYPTYAQVCVRLHTYIPQMHIPLHVCMHMHKTNKTYIHVPYYLYLRYLQLIPVPTWLFSTQDNFSL